MPTRSSAPGRTSIRLTCRCRCANLGAYARDIEPKLKQLAEPVGVYIFGHLADGNLHVMIGLNDDLPHEAIEAILYPGLTEMGGAFSAEHGIGLEKREAFGRFNSAAKSQTMAAIKAALDPHDILNPGKIFMPRRRNRDEARTNPDLTISASPLGDGRTLHARMPGCRNSRKKENDEMSEFDVENAKKEMERWYWWGIPTFFRCPWQEDPAPERHRAHRRAAQLGQRFDRARPASRPARRAQRLGAVPPRPRPLQHHPVGCLPASATPATCRCRKRWSTTSASSTSRLSPSASTRPARAWFRWAATMPSPDRWSRRWPARMRA